MEQKFDPLSTEVTKAVVNGAIYDIIEYDDYVKNKSSCIGNAAVRYCKDGKEMILPVKGKHYSGASVPGVYDSGPFDFFVLPSESNQEQYEPRKMVTFSNNDSIKSILEKEETISRLAEPWITSPDNITTFPISDDDQPEMKALKQALNSKNIDFDKYAPRFGANFPNDKRQLKNKSATLNIIKRFCDNCDLECEIIFRDKHPGVPNPMGEEIRVKITDSPEDPNN